jgi:hypothetical protein
MVIVAQKEAPKKTSKPAKANHSPSSGDSRLRDIVQVLLTGIVLAVVVIGVVVGIVMGTGKLAQAAPPPTANPSQQTVAAVPTFTPVPTATEIPCEAQAWWDANGVPFNAAVDALLAVTLETPPQQIVDHSGQIAPLRVALSGTASPCLAPLQSAMNAALDKADALYQTYLAPTVEKDRAVVHLALVDALLSVADAAAALPITTAAAWTAPLDTGYRGNCPAQRWFTEVMQVRDYHSFLALATNLDPATTSAADIQSKLLEMRRLSSSWAADSTAFPACTQAASDRWLAMMEATISGVNVQLNGDIATADGFYKQSQLELRNFVTEARTLGITLLGTGLPTE